MAATERAGTGRAAQVLLAVDELYEDQRSAVWGRGGASDLALCHVDASVDDPVET